MPEINDNVIDKSRLLHTFSAQGGGGGGGQAPLKFFQGGLFNPRGDFFRSNFNPKNHHFSDDFPVIFWYTLLAPNFMTPRIVTGV